MAFKFSKLNEYAQEPKRAHTYDAGYDLFACEDVVIEPYEKAMIGIGIAVSMPNDCYARIAPRSGLAAKFGIDVLAGVIDCTYSNEIKVILINHGNTTFNIKVGDKIAQMIFERIYTPEKLELVEYNVIIEENSKKSERGMGGFGSTGV
jgi:dUTP pyrophosphatase